MNQTTKINKPVECNVFIPPLSIETSKIDSDYLESPKEDRNPELDILTIVILGVSGDLAQKKIIPSLFRLYRSKFLPPHFNIVGSARSDLQNFEKFLYCLLKEGTDEEKSSFISHCYYVRITEFDKKDEWITLNDILSSSESKHCVTKDSKAVRIFYLSLPPSVFLSSASQISRYCIAGGTKIVCEKPFGKDYNSALSLDDGLRKLFHEEAIFRIDHYLGKEVLINLLILRFANLVFEDLWNRNFVQCVFITFKQSTGIGGRGQYFDKYGIIRDVLQNHMMQILSLVALEQPCSLAAKDIAREKVKILRCIDPPDLSNVVIGQYDSYLNEKYVSKDSITPTYAAVLLNIKNPRWDGVPFVLKCGNALNENKAEIRIHFRSVPGCLFDKVARNELVVNIQPTQSIYLKLCSKVPGLTNNTTQVELNLNLQQRFRGTHTVDAYERLLLDVFRGDHSLFVTNREIMEEWRIFTPILQELEEKRVKPVIYPFGSRSFPSADELVSRTGYIRNDNYQWVPLKERLEGLEPDLSRLGSLKLKNIQ